MMRASACIDRPALERRRTSPGPYSKMSASRPDASSRPGGSTVCSLARPRPRHSPDTVRSERSVQGERASSACAFGALAERVLDGGKEPLVDLDCRFPVDEEAVRPRQGREVDQGVEVVADSRRRTSRWRRRLAPYVEVDAPPTRDQWGRSWHRERPGPPVAPGRRTATTPHTRTHGGSVVPEARRPAGPAAELGTPSNGAPVVRTAPVRACRRRWTPPPVPQGTRSQSPDAPAAPAREGDRPSRVDAS